MVEHGTIFVPITTFPEFLSSQINSSVGCLIDQLVYWLITPYRRGGVVAWKAEDLPSVPLQHVSAKHPVPVQPQGLTHFRRAADQHHDRKGRAYNHLMTSLMT